MAEDKDEAYNVCHKRNQIFTRGTDEDTIAFLFFLLKPDVTQVKASLEVVHCIAEINLSPRQMGEFTF